jgi:steroid 5-alpha reductase family enzyme
MDLLSQVVQKYSVTWYQLEACLAGTVAVAGVNGTTTLEAVDSVACIAREGFLLSFALMIGMGIFTFLASAVTNNDSWVDRLWSISPVVFSWTFFASNVAAAGGKYRADSPGFLFCVMVTLWGCRLTYNFYRRGGYKKGGEDYRWAHVRSWPIFHSRLTWFVFSFIVVSVFQSWLLWAITVPIQVLPINSALSIPDSIFLGGFIFFLALEALTDQQQWEFQAEKRFLLPRRVGVDYDLGFCIDGVFAFSRHMNVWSEQSIWMMVWFAGASHQQTLSDPMALGAVILVALTIGSTTLTEKLSSKKYPEYKLYQQTTPMLIPSIRATDRYTKSLVARKKNL